MKKVIKNPLRLWVCEDCEISFICDEYEIDSSINFYTICPQCTERISGGMHDAPIFQPVPDSTDIAMKISNWRNT